MAVKNFDLPRKLMSEKKELKTLKCGPTRTMTEDESMCMMTLMMGEGDAKAALESTFLGRMLKARLDTMVPDHKVQDDVMALAAFLSHNPGCAVAWAWTLMAERIFTMHDFSMTFPFGVPTKEAFDTCWDAQKTECGDNAFDLKETWVVHLNTQPKPKKDDVLGEQFDKLLSENLQLAMSFLSAMDHMEPRNEISDDEKTTSPEEGTEAEPAPPVSAE